nr:hypothetical protein [Streptococcus equi]
MLDLMQDHASLCLFDSGCRLFWHWYGPWRLCVGYLSLPPTVRFTNLALRHIPTELVEASDAFGFNP